MTAMASEGGQQQGGQYADFLPVSISVGCQPDTPAADRLNIERARGVSQLILPAECVDRKKSVLNIYPDKIGVVYRKSLGVWNFILILNKKRIEY